MRNKVLIIVLILLAGGAIYYFGFRAEKQVDLNIDIFKECIDAGYPAMESYPRQCRAGDKTFVEDIGNELEKINLIRIDIPRPNSTIKSHLEIIGQARGYWFFEADFPVILTDWDGLIIAEAIATAQRDWMVEDFVPFTATLEFGKPYDEGAPDFMKRGTIIFQKDNPSGLPEHDDALEFTVFFE